VSLRSANCMWQATRERAGRGGGGGGRIRRGWPRLVKPRSRVAMAAAAVARPGRSWAFLLGVVCGRTGVCGCCPISPLPMAAGLGRKKTPPFQTVIPPAAWSSTAFSLSHPILCLSPPSPSLPRSPVPSPIFPPRPPSPSPPYHDGDINPPAARVSTPALWWPCQLPPVKSPRHGHRRIRPWRSTMANFNARLSICRGALIGSIPPAHRLNGSMGSRARRQMLAVCWQCLANDGRADATVERRSQVARA